MTIGFVSNKKASAALIITDMIETAKQAETDKRNELNAATENVADLEKMLNISNNLASLDFGEFNTLSNVFDQILEPKIFIKDISLNVLEELKLVMDSVNHYIADFTVTEEKVIVNPEGGGHALYIGYKEGDKNGGGWQQNEQVSSGAEFSPLEEETNMYLPVDLGQVVRFELNQEGRATTLKITILP